MADGHLRDAAAAPAAWTAVRIPSRRGLHAVEVEDGRVARVSAHGGPEPAADRRLLLFPGLIDAHVHLTFLPPAAGAEMAAAGVRTVRDVGGACARVRAWAADAGPDAPRALAYGEPLDGDPVEPRAAAFGAVPAAAPADVDAHLARLEREGADGLKLYFNFPPELARHACAGARRGGLRVAAHLASGSLPGFCRLSPLAFAAAGGHTVEHVHSFTAEVIAPADLARYAARTDLPSLSRVFLAWAECNLDAPRVDEAIDRFTATGAFLVPTLSVLALMPGCIPLPGVADPRVERFGDDPRFSYVRTGFGRMLEFVGRFHARGGRVAAGTDLAVADAGVAPAGALALEMRLLRRAGLSANEVLATATEGAAAALGMDEARVERGAPADFVVARAADADEFLATWRVEAVVRGGAVVHGRLPAEAVVAH